MNSLCWRRKLCAALTPRVITIDKETGRAHSASLREIERRALAFAEVIHWRDPHQAITCEEYGKMHDSNYSWILDSNRVEGLSPGLDSEGRIVAAASNLLWDEAGQLID
ncbi:MAG: hypothetical protein ABI284_01555 [Nitrosospira sp.]